MQNILFFKDCDGVLAQVKTAHLSNVTSDNLNKKAIAYIKNLVNLKGLTKVYDAWKKLKAKYQNIIPMNQVHLMRWGNDNYKIGRIKKYSSAYCSLL